MSGPQGVYAPRPAAVSVDVDGVPRRLDAIAVEAIREDWLVEDRWWTARPLRRHYYELVLADGRDVVVFHDLLARRWRRQSS
jgi:hypothetical protein